MPRGEGEAVGPGEEHEEEDPSINYCRHPSNLKEAGNRKAWSSSAGGGHYPEGTGEDDEEDDDGEESAADRAEEAAGTWYAPEDNEIWLPDCTRFVPFTDSFPRHFPSAKEDTSAERGNQKAWNPSTGEIQSSFEQARHANFHYDYLDWKSLVSCEEVFIEHTGGKGDRKCSLGNPCSCKPPCINEQSISTMRNLDFRSALNHVKISRINDASSFNCYWETTMLAAAFALLRENADIVEWVECRIAGNDKITSFLKDRTSWNLNIKLTENSKQALGSFVASNISNKLYIFQGNRWSDYVNAWKMPASSNSDVDRSTVALELSGTLLHELVHIVGYKANADTQEECFISYLIENMYRWAMYQRYPEAQADCSRLSPVYGSVGVDSLWGQDSSVWLRNSLTCPGSVVVPFDWIPDSVLRHILGQV